MRLTPLAKAFVTLVILATVGFITWHHLHSAPGPANEATPEHEHDHDHNYPARGKSGPITVGINEFGGAYPGIVANGGMRTQPSSRFAGRGLQVTFKLIRD